MATPIKSHKVSHVVLNVSDIERSTRFYTEILGFKVSDQIGWDGTSRPPEQYRQAKSLEEALGNPVAR